MPDLSQLSDEEILRNLPDEVILQQAGIHRQAQPPSTPFVPGQQRVEEAIANRGSGIGFLRAAGHNPAIIGQHPVITALSALGAPFEAGESTVANTALALQRGQMADIGRDVVAGLRGERPAQLGDVFRSVNVPDSISSLLGLTLMPGGAQLEEALGKGGVGLAQRGTTGLGQMGEKVTQFLKGNPKAIQTAKDELKAALQQSAKQLDSDAYDVVTSYRRGGSEHAGFFRQHGQLSDEAWEPVKQVASGVTQPIPVDELKAHISSQYADDPAFANKAHLILDDLFPEKATPSSPTLFGPTGRPVTSIAPAPEPVTTSAENMIQKLTDLNQSVRLSVRKGITPRNAGEQLISSIRSAAAQAIESRAPEDLKGLYQEGMNNWASHAADTRRLFRILKPGAAMEEPTAEGVNFIKKAVTGGFDTDRDTQEFIGRVRSRYGIDLPSSVTKSGQQIHSAEDALRTAQQVGTKGLLARKLALAAGAGAVGAAGWQGGKSILRMIFGEK